MTVVIPDWIWIFFTLALGCCVGSFLNVVVYRVPREKSLIRPGSACPSCDKHIRFYDNIPLLSWLILGRKCRYCKAPISPRYFVIELITGLLFVFTYFLLFRSGYRAGIPPFLSGGWLVYLLIIILLSALVACSAIDLELWIIPLTICWLITILAFITSALAPLLIDPKAIRGYFILPYASAKTAALGLGAAVGLGISLLLLVTGVIKRSYEWQHEHDADVPYEDENEPEYNHRLEVLREIVFLLPIIACAVAVYCLTDRVEPIRRFWLDFSQHPAIAGLLGSVYAYFIGCATVWFFRILGTLLFNKEAMGLGDVHLMGAAGAVVGAWPITAAFFIAPFFGLIWAMSQMFFRKTRQIPYGPWLSLGIFVVIILNDYIYAYYNRLFGIQ